MTGAAGLFVGNVVHKRLRPAAHSLSYRVFTMFVDVDRLDALGQRLRLFAYNGTNVFSLHDRDFGPGDGTPIAVHARHAFEAAGFVCAGGRIELLAYPRMFGYAFNPLSVFFLTDPSGRLAAVNYEVSNTFGERKSYVLAAGECSATGVFSQSCRKELFVSPFAAGSGKYLFRIRAPAEDVTVGVAYDDGCGPLIKTHFRGAFQELNDASLAGLMIRMPLMTFKVIVAIHYEAFRLWRKKVPLVRGHSSPRYSASYAPRPNAGRSSTAQ